VAGGWALVRLLASCISSALPSSSVSMTCGAMRVDRARSNGEPESIQTPRSAKPRPLRTTQATCTCLSTR
jgi:hypothetical protein